MGNSFKGIGVLKYIEYVKPVEISKYQNNLYKVSVSDTSIWNSASASLLLINQYHTGIFKQRERLMEIFIQHYPELIYACYAIVDG